MDAYTLQLMSPSELAYQEATEAIYVREIDDGWVISVLRMAFSDRVCLGRIEDTSTYDEGWCYPDRSMALRAAQAWNGEGDPPDGWIKQVPTGRCRVNGDPNRESKGWPVP